MLLDFLKTQNKKRIKIGTVIKNIIAKRALTINAIMTPPKTINGARTITLNPMKMVSRSEEHTSELQSRGHLVCRLLLEKKNKKEPTDPDPPTNNTEIKHIH